MFIYNSTRDSKPLAFMLGVRNLAVEVHRLWIR